jgi:hypothetical protein
MPMRVVDLEPGVHAPLYHHALVLSRPDQHVAWRGDALPSDPAALVDLIRGARQDPGFGSLTNKQVSA